MKEVGLIKTDKLIAPARAHLILTVATLFYILLGIAIGYFFVWDQYSTDSRYEQEIKDGVFNVQEKPNDISARVELGFIYMKAKRYNDAHREFSVALSIDPNSRLARLNMANLLLEMKKFKEAEKLLNDVAKSDSSYQAYSLLGKSNYLQKKYKAAIQSYLSARDLNPTDTETLYYLGLSYEKTGNKKMAAESYREALQYDPNYQQAKNALKRFGVK